MSIVQCPSARLLSFAYCWHLREMSLLTSASACFQNSSRCEAAAHLAGITLQIPNTTLFPGSEYAVWLSCDSKHTSKSKVSELQCKFTRQMTKCCHPNIHHGTSTGCLFLIRRECIWQQNPRISPNSLLTLQSKP